MDAKEAMAIVKTTAEGVGGGSFADAVYTLFTLMHAEQLVPIWGSGIADIGGHPLQTAPLKAAWGGTAMPRSEYSDLRAKFTQLQLKLDGAIASNVGLNAERSALIKELNTVRADNSTLRSQITDYRKVCTYNVELNTKLQNERNDASFLRELIELASVQHNKDTEALAEVTKQRDCAYASGAPGYIINLRETIDHLRSQLAEAKLQNDKAADVHAKTIERMLANEADRKQHYRDQGAEQMRSAISLNIGPSRAYSQDICRNTAIPSASHYE